MTSQPLGPERDSDGTAVTHTVREARGGCLTGSRKRRRRKIYCYF